MQATILRFLTSEEGPTAVEYAIMLALIVLVSLAGMISLGQQSNQTFETISTILEPPP